MSTATLQESAPPTQPRTAQPERRQWLYPQVNILETKDAYLLEAEMPGVSKAGLEILLEGNQLTIVGRRAQDHGGSEVYRESSDSDYRRSFELDPSIDSSRIKARMDQGILYLDLPKPELVKPRKIAVE